jgi:hypothetical protein
MQVFAKEHLNERIDMESSKEHAPSWSPTVVRFAVSAPILSPFCGLGKHEHRFKIMKKGVASFHKHAELTKMGL